MCKPFINNFVLYFIYTPIHQPYINQKAMENTDPKFQETSGEKKPIETDYAKHEQNPGPSPQAVEEDNDKGAGPVMKWIIPIIVFILLIFWFIFWK